MKPQKQLFRHKPEEGVYGDCHRTVFAAMFDMDAKDVPHFLLEAGNDGPGQHARSEKWLKKKGYREFHFPYHGTLEQVLNMMGQINADNYYLLSGISANNTGHYVICRGGEIACDPSLDNTGIVEPYEDGLYWITVFINKRFSSNA